MADNSEIFGSEDRVKTYPALLFAGRRKGIFFYNFSTLHKFLHMKANLEMFYLPGKTFRHKYNHYPITIGKPISYLNFDKSLIPVERADKVKQLCYAPENNRAYELTYQLTDYKK